jgi:hypothetical protein
MATRQSGRTKAKKAKEKEEYLVCCIGCCGPFPMNKEYPKAEPYLQGKAFDTPWGSELRLCFKCKHWVHGECMSANSTTTCRTCYAKGLFAAVKGLDPGKVLHVPLFKNRCSLCLKVCSNAFFGCDNGKECIQYKDTGSAWAIVCATCAENRGKICLRCTTKPGAVVAGEPAGDTSSTPSSLVLAEPVPGSGALVPAPAADDSSSKHGALVPGQADDDANGLSASQVACAPVVQDPVVMDGSTITQNVAKRAILKSLEASELQGHERLAELLCKWLVDEKWVPDLHYNNFKPSAGVRIRPSFALRVMEKLTILMQHGWLHHLYVIARYPKGREVHKMVEGEPWPADVALDIIDGHHRVEAVGLLEGLGYGPEGKISPGRWILPTVILKAETPDEVCRAIAWGLTDNQRYSHYMTTVDTLHWIRACAEPLLASNVHNNVIVSTTEKELSLVAMEGQDPVLTGKNVENAIAFYKCVRTVNTSGHSAYDEIMLLASQHHINVFKNVQLLGGKLLCSTEENGVPPMLATPASCFLPFFGTGTKAKGGFLPAGDKQSIFIQKTPVDEQIALIQRAYSYWILSGGNFMPRTMWENLVGMDKGKAMDPAAQAKATAWQKQCKEDTLTIETLRGDTDLFVLQAMQVMAFSGQRDVLHSAVLRWKELRPKHDITVSGACIAGCSDEQCAKLSKAAQPQAVEDDGGHGEDDDVNRAEQEQDEPNGGQAEPPTVREGNKSKGKRKKRVDDDIEDLTGGQETEATTSQKRLRKATDRFEPTSAQKKTPRRPTATPPADAAEEEEEEDKGDENEGEGAEGDAPVLSEDDDDEVRFALVTADYKKLIALVHGSKPGKAVNLLLGPDVKVLQSPSIIFTTIDRTRSELSYTTRLQRFASQFRIAEKLFQKHGGEQGDLPPLFAFSVATPWDMAAAQHTVLTKNWFLHAPYSAHDPLTDKSSYIICASLTPDQSATRNEVLDREKTAGRQGVGYPNEADWTLAFGPSTRQLQPLPAGSGFTMAEQLATRFLFDSTLLGEVVWVMGNSSMNTHIAVAAVAMNMKPMLLLDDDDRDKIEIVLQAAADLRDSDEMWRMYKDPACIFTIVALANAAVPDSESDPANLRQLHRPPRDFTTVDAVGFTNTAYIQDYEVKESQHKTADGKEIGLGVFTKTDFKKGDMAFEVFNCIFLLL